MNQATQDKLFTGFDGPVIFGSMPKEADAPIEFEVARKGEPAVDDRFIYMPVMYRDATYDVLVKSVATGEVYSALRDVRHPAFAEMSGTVRKFQNGHSMPILEGHGGHITATFNDIYGRVCVELDIIQYGNLAFLVEMQ